MHQLRIFYLPPLDFPDVADCDGSCSGLAGGGGPCILHAGICCPDDSLDTVMDSPYLFSDDLLEDLLIAAALPPPHRGVLRAAEAADKEVLVDMDAAAADVGFYSDRGSCSDAAPRLPPVHAALSSSDSSWTTSSTPETTDSPPPSPVSRLVVPRKKRDRSVKRGKRMWSLDIPSVPASRANNPSGTGGGGDQDYGDRIVAAAGSDGGVRQRLVGARRPSTNGRAQRACRHCDSTETPQWRAGPDGPGTLCNACGIRYTKKMLLPEYRPSTSPSFRSDKHSNRHRKVVKLREKKVKEETTASMTPPASDSGDFMDVCK